MRFKAMPGSIAGSVIPVLTLGAALLIGGAPAFAQSSPDMSLPWSTQASQQSQMHHAAAAARKNLAEFVQFRLQSGSLPKGFPLDISDIQDLKGLSIGRGFQVHTVDPNEVLAGRKEVSGMVKPTGEWRFVISSKGRPVGLATVHQVDGRWETVAYGAAELSKEVDSLMAKHGNADHSNLRFVRVFQARSDFIEVTSEKNFGKRFAPLRSARQSLSLQQQTAKAGSSGDGLIDAADFLDPLRAAIKTNLAEFR
ncbi:MAG TPA: hypothetical protein VEC06_18430 [Paucimonas sp.]|nr:hypothetical protein [Paucimonas sp.]